MKRLGLTIKVSVILSMAFFLVTCGRLTGTLYEKPLFAKEIWGEWIRMDTGETWYFASNYRMVGSSTYTDPVNMVKQSQNVIKVTEGTGANSKDYFLYASRIRNSTFEASVVSEGNNALSAVSARAGIYVPHGPKPTVVNIKSPLDEQTVEINDNGEFEAESIIAGDDYIVTIDGYEFIVTPQTDGENVGTLTLTNGVNIKTSIEPKPVGYWDEPVDLMRLYSGKSYTLTLKFTNVGEEVSSAMEYRLTLPDEIVITKIGDSTTRLDGGDLQSILPGITRSVDITISCGSISEDYEFKNIEIETEDFYRKTWNDSVSLRVNRESVTFNIRSNLEINGVVIVPNGKAYHFKTANSNGVIQAAVTVPKYLKDYLVVFSGASADSEAKYSFVADRVPSTDFANYPLTGPDGLNKYWPNGTEGQAAPVRHDQEVRAYLMMNQANYYKVQFGE